MCALPWNQWHFCCKCCEQSCLSFKINVQVPVFHHLQSQLSAAVCPPSSLNQLHQSLPSTVGWVSHFRQLTAEVTCRAQPCSAQLSSAPINRSASPSAESGLSHSRDTRTQSTAAEMMHVAFLLLLVFTGKIELVSVSERCLIVVFGKVLIKT